MKKILILTSEKTGNGHKMAANAIEKKLQPMGYDVKKLNCFTTMGKMGVSMESSYIPITTKKPWLWKIAHSFTQICTNTMHWFIYNKCKKQMLKQIKEYNPDLIITVHCMFTKAISKLLKKNNLNIPLMVNVIDLVNPPKVWRDKNAVMSFLPTELVKEQYLKLGFKPQQLVVSGFPIREDIKQLTQPKQIKDKVNILMVNPSVNLKKNIEFVKQTARVKNANIKVVCGLDNRMLEALNKEKSRNPNLNNVEVLGYVTNMNELLADCHILITKAGPNMILEGTRSGSAVVCSGHIPGQEAKNHEYITKNGYGIQCENPKKLYAELTSMIETGKINEYLSNVLNADCNDGAKVIAEHVDAYLNNK